MKIKDITNYLETIAPPAYQEDYDNARLIVGDPNAKLTGAVLCLDAIEAVVDDAIAKGCNLIIAHHPIVFMGLKSLTGKNYIERVVIKAIQNNIAIYASHTNLDNVDHGVNAKICEKLGLLNCRVLAPKSGQLKKIYTFCPADKVDEIREAMANAGAGVIGNYDQCSFNIEGVGTFKGGEGSNPYVGEQGKLSKEPEIKLEMLFPIHVQGRVINALTQTHPYEEVAYDIIALENEHPLIGSGMIGELPEPVEAMAFLKSLKTTMQTECIRYTQPNGNPIKKVAVCGGAGSFLLRSAMGQGADIFITGDYKYHQFFDAEGKIIIADIGHYESEQFTMALFHEFLTKKFGNFALHYTSINTNPVKYL